MKPFVHEIPQIDPVLAFTAIKHMPYSLLLDSADLKHQHNRYSFLMCQPIETIEARDRKINITNWDQKLTFHGDPLSIIAARMQSWISTTKHIKNLPPFQGGAAGLFSYDLARTIEKLPNSAKDDTGSPDIAIGIYDQVLACDLLLKKCWVITHARNEEEATKKRDYFLKLITNYKTPLPYVPVPMEWESNFDAPDYMDNIEKIIDYIKAGDIFQANISQRFDAVRPQNFDPYSHYLHLRQINPAPFACYMNLGSIIVSSASPERFLTLRDGVVQTSPIKGTRPHVHDLIQDRAYKTDLKNSAKDNAENTMIVDLMRNDLARVCEPGSVVVTDLCKLETFAHVHHLVSTIKGHLRQDKTAIDLLRAAFPGGSITGAPKIRAMEIIEEIEDTRRGPYYGSIGYIGFDNTMDTNILIRTLVYTDKRVSVQVGGGIVVDSDANTEYQETFDKANAILNSFDHDSAALGNTLAEAI